MSNHDDLVRRLLTVIDLTDWRQLATPVTEDVRYDRPGCPTIDGHTEGVSRAGVPLSEIFAAWYELNGNQVCRRRSFVYRPAI